MNLQEIKSAFKDGAELTDDEIRWLIAEVELMQKKLDSVASKLSWQVEQTVKANAELLSVQQQTAQRCAVLCEEKAHKGLQPRNEWFGKFFADAIRNEFNL